MVGGVYQCYVLSLQAHVLRLGRVAHVIDVCAFVLMLACLYSLRVMSMWLVLMVLLLVAIHVYASSAGACNDRGKFCLDCC